MDFTLVDRSLVIAVRERGAPFDLTAEDNSTGTESDPLERSGIGIHGDRGRRVFDYVKSCLGY